MKFIILALIAIIILSGCSESRENTEFLDAFCLENGYNQAEFKAKGEAVCWIVGNENAEIKKVICSYEEDIITGCEIIEWDN